MYLLKRLPRTERTAVLSYLHSTMYLLKLRSGGKPYFLFLHLHSTMYLLKLKLPVLCHKSTKFTFHYVSIKTLISFFKALTPDLFTFHYVSIKTNGVTLWGSHDGHLHSTMYLLKRVRHNVIGKLPRKFTFHYVSIKTKLTILCIILYNVFTFHYVSIKTVFSAVIC